MWQSICYGWFTWNEICGKNPEFGGSQISLGMIVSYAAHPYLPWFLSGYFGVKQRSSWLGESSLWLIKVLEPPKQLSLVEDAPAVLIAHSYSRDDWFPMAICTGGSWEMAKKRWPASTYPSVPKLSVNKTWDRGSVHQIPKAIFFQVSHNALPRKTSFSIRGPRNSRPKVFVKTVTS